MGQDMTSSFPSRLRVALAFVTAPSMAALLMAIAMPAYDGMESNLERIWLTAKIYALVGAYPTALLLGIPAYFLLRKRLKPTWVNCALVGGAVAALPWLLLTALPTADHSSVGGRATIIDGHTTSYGWLVNLQSVGTIAVFGAIAGGVFWLTTMGGRGSNPRDL